MILGSASNNIFRFHCMQINFAEIIFDFMYPLGYDIYMMEVRQTDEYSDWFAKLRDRQARARINARIRRLSLGNPGDVKPVGEGISELRIDYGPGYRVYFLQRGREVVILLAGGDKRTQQKDIQTALQLVRNL
jgi:putative addiction module killer protein